MTATDASVVAAAIAPTAGAIAPTAGAVATGVASAGGSTGSTGGEVLDSRKPAADTFQDRSPSFPGNPPSSVYGSPLITGRNSLNIWSINMEPSIYGVPSLSAATAPKVTFRVSKSRTPASGTTTSPICQLPRPMQSSPHRRMLPGKKRLILR